MDHLRMDCLLGRGEPRHLGGRHANRREHAHFVWCDRFRVRCCFQALPEGNPIAGTGFQSARTVRSAYCNAKTRPHKSAINISPQIGPVAVDATGLFCRLLGSDLQRQNHDTAPKSLFFEERGGSHALASIHILSTREKKKMNVPFNLTNLGNPMKTSKTLLKLTAVAAALACSQLAAAQGISVTDYEEATSEYQDAYVSGTFNAGKTRADAQSTYDLNLGLDYEQVFSSTNRDLQLRFDGTGAVGRDGTEGASRVSRYEYATGATIDNYFNPESHLAF